MNKDTYNFVVLADRGFEEIVMGDIKNFLDKEKVEVRVLEKLSAFIISDITLEKMLHLTYLTGSIRDAMILLAFSEVKDIEKLDKILVPFKASKFKFKIIRERKYKNLDLLKTLKDKMEFFGGMVLDRILIRLYVVDDYFILGIPLMENIEKRGYKIKEVEGSLNPVAANLLLKCLWNDEKTMVIYTKDGTLPIEAGIILKNIPPHFWDKKKFLVNYDISFFIDLDQKSIRDVKSRILVIDSYGRNISISKKNSINALVKDILYFKKLDLKYLDLIIKDKYKFIIADFYKMSKENIKYILYFAKFLLDDGGRLIVLSDKDINKIVSHYCSKYNLKIVEAGMGRFLYDRYFYYVIVH
ncbi:hypothetical protein BA065_01830 [Nanoarchaeota archaeon NZ13-N]|nr:MAG: hypothetical protein BA065_01830 [Nanoarchaeota archaeon NZ13-N]